MNICFIGNSVTAQKESYRFELQRLIAEHLANDVTFINCSLGGIGSLGISFFVNRFVGDKPVDICFVETFVADLKNATPRNYVKSALRGILQNPCLVNSKIIPLYLYRSDIGDDVYLSLLDLYNQAYQPYNINSINVFSYVSRLINNQQFRPEYLVYDQIHTTKDGARLYAEYIFSQISSSFIYLQSPAKRFIDAEAIVPLKSDNFSRRVLSGDFELGVFRFILPYLKVSLGNHIELKTEYGGCIGLIVIADAETGVVEVSSNGLQHKAQVYDPWCKYARIQVVIFPQPIEQNKLIRITASHDEFTTYGANGSSHDVIQRGNNIKVVELMEFDLVQVQRH